MKLDTIVNSYVKENTLTLDTKTKKIIFGFVEHDIIRVKICGDMSIKTTAPVILQKEPSYIAFDLIDQSDCLIMKSEKTSVHINVKAFGFKVFDDNSTLLFSTVEYDPIKYSEREIVLSLILNRGENIYGLGQDPMANLNQRDKERRMWNSTDKKRKSGNSSIPFYTSSCGYGLFLNSPRPSRFAIGKAVLAERPETRTDELGLDRNPYPWSWEEPNPYNDPDDISIILDSDCFDVFFICRKAPDAIQKGYADLTGHAPMPPLWAYGFIQCKNRYRSMEELIMIAKKYREKKVPLDCLVIDWLWFKEFGDFEWDDQYWPDPDEGIKELNKLGIKVMSAQHPFIDREALKFEQLKDEGFLNVVPDHARPTYDFSNPKAQKYFWDVLVKKLYESGIRGYWTDMGELEDHYPGTKSFSGEREDVHNIYSNLWSEAIYKGQRRDFNERVFILSRAVYAGIQKYGVTLWSNDISASWEVLKDQVVLGQTVALSGQQYWCTDIGGFITKREFTPELYIRWFQWGVFCPIFRTHGTRPDNEIWSFGKPAEEILSNFVKLRYKLITYIYSCARKVTKDGKPIMRAMYMDFPDDPEAVLQESQYMFGPSFLVAPVTEKGARSRKVYLPEGIWYNFWTNEKIIGGQYIDESAPLYKIPLFVKAGAIIPTVEPGTNTGDSDKGEINLYLYPGDEGCFDLYEDDGNTYDYEKGIYGLTRIVMDKEGDIQTEILHSAGNYPLQDRKLVKVYPVSKPVDSVVFNVDADMDDAGLCHIQATVENNTGCEVSVKAQLLPVEGFEGCLSDSYTFSGKGLHVFRVVLKPSSDLLPLLFHGTVRFEADYENQKNIEEKQFTFGSGFASRFELIGDFIYDDSYGIDTPTPVENDPDKPYYTFNGKQYSRYRRKDYEFNCMGYVYCWKEKIEDGPRPVSYAKCKVYSDNDKIVRIECSGDQALKIFLNGQEIFKRNTSVIRQIIPGSFKLNKGYNDVLIKVAQNHPKPFSGRELGFNFRFVDEEGEILEDLLYRP